MRRSAVHKDGHDHSPLVDTPHAEAIAAAASTGSSARVMLLMTATPAAP
jgi:hypothetical protein